MRIYMDVCCLSRPFDDLSQDKVYLEAEAILSIMSHCEQGEWTLVASGVIEHELSRSTDTDKLEQVLEFYAAASERIVLTKQTENRAAFFQQNGIKSFDSLHLALAETNGVDVFLTTDDSLLRKANKMDLNITVANPVSWLMEGLNNDQ